MGKQSADMDSRLDQIVCFVEDLLKAAPLLLVVDDLHYADTATIDLLATAALRVEGPLTLVLAYRSEALQLTHGTEPHPLRRAIFRLRRQRNDLLERQLERLSAKDTEALIRRAVGTPITSQQLAAIVERSVGIPLFAESLAAVGGGHREYSAADAPSQIKAVLEERLSFLSVDDQQLLESAALIGYMFEVDYLATLAHEDTDELYDRLDLIIRDHGLIGPSEPRGLLERYQLYHPLLGEVLRQRGLANAPRWRRSHRRLLELILKDRPWDDELAVRAVAFAVEAGDQASACKFGLDAGRRQFEIGAVAKACQLARVAAEQGRGTPEEFDALSLLAECLSAEADHFGAAQICERAVQIATQSYITGGSPRTIKLLWARNLRMINAWTRTEEVLAELEVESKLEDDLATLAEVQMLRAEIALCGPVQDTNRCIELCDQVLKVTTDVALQSRALGHKGTASLAANDPVAAEMWLNKAIELARVKGHPYAEYEAIHWLSKKTMACLELARAAELLDVLANNSEASGVASEEPFHLRDSSRVFGLSGMIDAAARSFAGYFDIAFDYAVDRVLATLACQLHEIETLRGKGVGDELIEAVASAAATDMVDPDRRGQLEGALAMLRRRLPGWQPTLLAVEALGADPAEVRAADAIFRFDVGSLEHLRSTYGFGITA